MNYRVLMTFIGAAAFASYACASLDGNGRRGHDEHTGELSGQYDPTGPIPTEDGMTINETPDAVERGPNEHKGVGGGNHKVKKKKAEGDKADAKPEEKKAEGDKADAKPEEKKAEGDKADAKPEEHKAEGDKADAKPEEHKAEGDKADAKPEEHK